MTRCGLREHRSLRCQRDLSEEEKQRVVKAEAKIVED